MITYQTVRDNVHAFMTGQGANAWHSASDVLAVVAKAAGVDTSENGYQRYRGYGSAGQTLEGQVKRALNDLAGRGVLVKRMRKPVGARQQAFYATPALHDREVKARMDADRVREADKALAEAARDHVLARLEAAGIDARYYGHTGPVPTFIVGLTPELLDKLRLVLN